MMADLSQLSSFTGNHGQHDSKWMFPGSRPQSFFCLACAVETFEGPSSEVPAIRKKHLLGELLKAINSHEKLLLELLIEESHVAAHLTQTVYSILEVSDETLSTVVIEVLVQLCCALKSEELVCYLVHQISIQVQQACSFSVTLPSLTLLGQLLHSIPGLVHTVKQDEAPLIAHILTGLTYPDEKVKSSCAFILAQAIAPPTEGSRQVCWWRELADGVLPLLSTAQSKELKTNSMGLLKRLLEQEDMTRSLMQYQGKASLASVLKKMLLSRDNTLQVTSVQCTAQVLLHQKAQRPSTHCQYAEELLNGDVAEFLYEALATTNGLLLSSVFCCLLLFTEVDGFFSKCHTVYGIESIVRAVQQSAKLNNTEALSHGLQLLSEIFKKQPKDIHLMNNEATLTQLCSLLADCMTHTVITTVIHATQTLANLLRWDHLPKPVHFQPLVSTLRALLGSLQRLSQSLVAGSGGGEHRPAISHRRSQQPRHARLDRPGRPRGMKQESLLSCGLEALWKALRLAAVCLKDPSSTESQFTAPDSQTTDGKTQGCGPDSLVEFLLLALDGTCIPLVMTNFDCISRPDIFTSLFGMLCVAMEIGGSNTHKFSVKLASSSFIQLALTVKNRFTTEDSQLQDVITCFLSELCASLQDPCPAPEDQQQLRDTLQQALPQIQGSADEMLHLLHELPPSTSSSRGPVGPDDHLDRSLQLKQQACLALLYYASLHNDKLAHESAVHKAILAYLTNHPNLKTLPRYTSKHLLLLLATCHGNRNEQSIHAGVQSFLEVLESGDMSYIYTHHPSILDWCFGPGCQRSDCARRILEQWLLHYLAGDNLGGADGREDGNDTASKLLQMNPTCFEIILGIVASGSQQLVQASLALLERVFSSQESCHQEAAQVVLRVLERSLPDIIQRIFISEDQSPSDVHILALLRLMCTVHQQFPKSLLDAADIKLTYHVSNLISRTTSSNPDVLQASLNYLTVLLIQTAPHEETRVVSVLLSNASTLNLLEGLLSPQGPCQPAGSLQCACLSLVAQIIPCQAKFNIKVPHIMTLDVSSALELIRRNKHILRKVCGLHLWTALFSTKFASPVLRLLNRSHRGTLAEDEDLASGISARNIMSVYAWLQNSIVQGDALLSQAAVTCMRSLIRYVQEKSPSLASHLLAHPWNHQLVSHCLDCSLASGRLPAYVMQLVTMFLGRGNGDNVVGVHQLEGVADCLKSVDTSCDDASQPILSDALMLAQQAIVQPDVKLTLQTVRDLRTFLQQVAMGNKRRLPWRQNNVIQMKGVVVQHPTSVSLYSKGNLQADEMKAIAKELIQKLAKYQE